MTNTKKYRGLRSPLGCQVMIVQGRTVRELVNRTDIRNHSPAGFEWGYGGSGPTQLVLSLCAECLGDRCAAAIYQRAKADVLALLSGDRWILWDQDLRNILRPYAEQFWQARRRTRGPRGKWRLA